MTKTNVFIVAAVLCCATMLTAASAWGIYGVRISDLGYSPQPPNPIKIWGQVVSVSPMTVTDGVGTIQGDRGNGSVGDFVVLTGNWNGSVLLVQEPEIIALWCTSRPAAS